MPTEALPSIYLYDVHRAGRDRLTTDRATEVFPVWSPDGRSIVYGEAKGSPPTLVRRLLAGGDAETLSTSVHQAAGNFSPDGTMLYFAQFPPGRPAETLRLLLDGTKRVETVVSSSFNNGDPQVSPDGKWLAFVSYTADGSGIYLLPLGGGERIRISDKGGYMPRWSRSVSPSGDSFLIGETRAGEGDGDISRSS